jgi:DNA-binding NarL/FixJ family response regulator
MAQHRAVAQHVKTLVVMNAPVTQKSLFPFSLMGVVSSNAQPPTRDNFPIRSGILPEAWPIRQNAQVHGHSINDIAQSIGRPKTVSNHRTAIKQKLGADTAIQLLRIAKKFGLEPQS